MTSRAQIAPLPDSLKHSLSRLWHDESGQDMVEYALITLAMGLGTVAGVHGLASSIDNDLTTVLNAFNVATAAAH